MALSMSGNELYASVKAEGRFLLEEGVLKLDDAHGSFVQEEVLVSGRREQDTFGVQAAALKKGVWTSRGRVQKVQGGHTGNPTLLSWLSLVVVDWRKACQ